MASDGRCGIGLGVSRFNLNAHLTGQVKPRWRYHKSKHASGWPLFIRLLATWPTYGSRRSRALICARNAPRSSSPSAFAHWLAGEENSPSGASRRLGNWCWRDAILSGRITRMTARPLRRAQNCVGARAAWPLSVIEGNRLLVDNLRAATAASSGPLSSSTP